MKLGTKINLVLFFVTVIILTATFSVVVNFEAKTTKSQVLRDAETAADIFHKEIERMYKQISDQQIRLQDTIDELSKIEGVLYINVTNMDGVHVATTDHTLIGTIVKESDINLIRKIGEGASVADIRNDKGTYYELERRIPIHLEYANSSSAIIDVIEVEVVTRSKTQTDIAQAEKLLRAISASVEQAARSIIVTYEEDIRSIQSITSSVTDLGKINQNDEFGFFHHFIVSDDKLNIIANSDGDKNEFINDTEEHNKYREDVLSGNITEVSYESADHDGHKVLIEVKPIQLEVNGSSKIVGIKETHLLLSSYEDKINALKFRMIGIGVIFTIVLVMVLVAALEREVVGPIRRYSIVAKKVAGGDLSQKVEYKSNDEIGQFGEVFNSMVRSLLELDKAKSDFISVAAHQLRTPLSGLKWALKLILDGDFGAINDEQKDVLKRGFESNEKMIQLVNDLLDVSRIDKKEYGYNFEKNDFGELLNILMGNVDLYAKENNVNVHLENRAGDITKFLFDQKKLLIALQNIVDNALKYTHSGGSVSVVVEKQGDYLEIKISDTGVGIPKADLSKLFSKFFRASNVIHLQTEGSGLGLFIVKNIIERHGGSISVDSVEGKGTTFIVLLPTKEELIPMEPKTTEEPKAVNNA